MFLVESLRAFQNDQILVQGGVGNGGHVALPFAHGDRRVLETIKPLDLGRQRIQGEIKAEINPYNLDIDADQRFNKFGYRGSLSYVDQFSFGDGELGISLGYERRDSNNPEQEEAEETVSVDYSGDDLEVGFNVSYIQDVLGVIEADKVKITLHNANSSALLEEPENEDSVYVVMPMKL